MKQTFFQFRALISAECQAKCGKEIPRGPQEGGIAGNGVGAADEAAAEAEERQDAEGAAQEEQQGDDSGTRLRLRLRQEDVHQDQLDFPRFRVRGLGGLFVPQFRLEVLQIFHL